MSTPLGATSTTTTADVAKGTAYIVLERIAAAALAARNLSTASYLPSAIRKAGEDAGAGTYIAVPARSFVTTKVTVETSKIVKLG